MNNTSLLFQKTNKEMQYSTFKAAYICPKILEDLGHLKSQFSQGSSIDDWKKKAIINCVHSFKVNKLLSDLEITLLGASIPFLTIFIQIP